ncbi:MAG: pentapeptide repeat-containing protein [Phormidesmis sp.]
MHGVTRTLMDYEALLAQGIEYWNQWRADYPDEPCDLSGADLSEGYFFEGDFRGVVLKGANLQRACLIGADFRGANLNNANLSGAYAGDANLRGATLCYANLKDTNFHQADLRQIDLDSTNIDEADTVRALFSETNALSLQQVLPRSTTSSITTTIDLDSIEGDPEAPNRWGKKLGRFGRPVRRPLAWVGAIAIISLAIRLYRELTR